MRSKQKADRHAGAEQPPASGQGPGQQLPQFFIRLLTDPGDLVVDIFAGSNTSGSVAESEGRYWLAFDERRDYLAASAFRFLPKNTAPDEMAAVFNQINAGENLHLATRLL